MKKQQWHPTFARRPRLWEEYGGWLAVLHQMVFREVETMAKTKRRKFDFELAPLFEAVGEERVLKVMGPERVAQFLESDECVEQLSPEQRRRLIEKLGVVPAARPPA